MKETHPPLDKAVTLLEFIGRIIFLKMVTSEQSILSLMQNRLHLRMKREYAVEFVVDVIKRKYS